MKNLTAFSENLLSEHYAQPAFLPPLWRVIFQEAMRGNHIIFPRSLVAAYQDLSWEMTRFQASHSLEEFCVHLFAAPDLKTIRSMVRLLPGDEQKQLFLIYLRTMQTIREENKNHLH